MKAFYRFALLFSTIFIFSCTKPEQHTTEIPSIAGAWRLVETLADPGDGSGTWKPVAPSAQNFLILKSTGSIEGTAFPQARRYEVVNDSTLKFTFTDGTFIYYTYSLTGSTLALSGGGCIEACGAKFIKTAVQP